MSSISGSSLSITGSTTLNGLSVASGSTTLSSVQTENFSQSGASTFSTGSGLVSLNGQVISNAGVVVGTDLMVNGTSSLIGATTVSGVLQANNGIKIPVNKSIYLSTDNNNYITNSSTGSGSITYATFDSGKTHDFYCYNGSKIYTISSSGTTTNGTGTFSGALTANAGVTVPSGQVINANGGLNAGSSTIQTTGTVSGGTGTFSGGSANANFEGLTLLTTANTGNGIGQQINFKCYKSLNTGIISQASIQTIRENTAVDYSSGLAFSTLTSSEPLTEKMRITASGNVGIGTTTPSYKLDVNGTGNFTGALTANAGVKIPTGLQLFLSADGNNYITNNSTNVKIQYVTFDAGKSHDFWVVDGSKFNISQTGTNVYGTETVSGLLTATSGVTTGNSAKITTKCSATATRYGEINTNSDGNTMFNIISEITGNGYFFMYNTSTELLRVNPTEITASKIINANAGLTIPAGQRLTVNGTYSPSAITTSGLITANGNITMGTNKYINLPTNNTVSPTTNQLGGYSSTTLPSNITLTSTQPYASYSATLPCHGVYMCYFTYNLLNSYSTTNNSTYMYESFDLVTGTPRIFSKGGYIAPIPMPSFASITQTGTFFFDTRVYNPTTLDVTFNTTLYFSNASIKFDGGTIKFMRIA